MAREEHTPVKSEVPAHVVTTRAQKFCLNKITRGRYVGRTCVNASPCYTHDVRPLALNLQAQGPDEYPFGFYEAMAREHIALRQSPPPPRKVVRRGSVLW